MTLARVRIGCLDDEVSALGFGCASLGSRIAPAAGLAALARAFDAGVSWYDVAPSYGDGQAEMLLGRFLRGRRDAVRVLTKVGIAPPRASLKQRLARPAMRLALGLAPGLRAAIRKRRPAATKLPLDAAAIAPSLDASLARLGTGHVDVLALHDATPDEVARDDVIRALERAIASGKTRAVAIASSTQAAAAGLAASSVYGLVQFGNNALAAGDPVAEATAPRPGIDRITHSAFGTDGAVARLAARIAADAALRSAMTAGGYEGAPNAMAAAFLADYAFATNPDGLVLMSMFDARHLADNLDRYARRRDDAAVAAIAHRLRTGDRP